jgi:hypothetical protein
MVGDTPTIAFADKREALDECIHQVQELYEDRGYTADEFEMPEGVQGLDAWNELFATVPELRVYVQDVPYVCTSTYPPEELCPTP